MVHLQLDSPMVLFIDTHDIVKILSKSKIITILYHGLALPITL
jgi:hypothetical protein